MPEIEEDDIAADLRAAFAGDTAPAEETPQVQPEAEASAEAQDGRVRDEKGRFAPKETGSTEQPQKVLAEGQEQVQSQLATEPPSETIQPPHSLSATVKAVFGTLPPEVRQEFVRLEEAFQKGKTEWSQKAEQFNRYEELIAPHRDRLSLAGTDPQRYIQGLITADEMLRGPNASQALAQIAQMYGLSNPLANQDAGRPQVDPNVQALQQQVATLSQQLQGQITDKETAAKQEALGRVEAFRNARDETGNLTHLYFDNVKDLMHDLIANGRAAGLDEAYEMATYAHPEVRKLLQPKAPPVPATPAGKQVTGAPPPGKLNGSADSNSIEDDVRNAIREAAGAV